MAVSPGSPLTHRPLAIERFGRTVQVTAGHGVSAVAIPYFQWDNRGPGAMRVWVPAPDQ